MQDATRKIVLTAPTRRTSAVGRDDVAASNTQHSRTAGWWLATRSTTNGARTGGVHDPAFGKDWRRLYRGRNPIFRPAPKRMGTRRQAAPACVKGGRARGGGRGGTTAAGGLSPSVSEGQAGTSRFTMVVGGGLDSQFIFNYE